MNWTVKSKVVLTSGILSGFDEVSSYKFAFWLSLPGMSVRIFPVNKRNYINTHKKVLGKFCNNTCGFCHYSTGPGALKEI